MPRKVLGSWWKGAFPCRFPAVIFPFGDDRYEKINCRLLAGSAGLNGRLRLRYRRDVKLLVPQRDDLFASKVADTFEEAVDLCVDALKRQLEKGKDR